MELNNLMQKFKLTSFMGVRGPSSPKLRKFWKIHMFRNDFPMSKIENFLSLKALGNFFGGAINHPPPQSPLTFPQLR